MTKYIRTELKPFHEMPENVRLAFTNYQGIYFVLDPCDPLNYIPLYMFEQYTGKIWDGVYTLSNHAAYYIKIGKDGRVTVAYKTR